MLSMLKLPRLKNLVQTDGGILSDLLKLFLSGRKVVKYRHDDDALSGNLVSQSLKFFFVHFTNPHDRPFVMVAEAGGESISPRRGRLS